jgi:hypothetical protein
VVVKSQPEFSAASNTTSKSSPTTSSLIISHCLQKPEEIFQSLRAFLSNLKSLSHQALGSGARILGNRLCRRLLPFHQRQMGVHMFRMVILLSAAISMISATVSYLTLSHNPLPKLESRLWLTSHLDTCSTTFEGCNNAFRTCNINTCNRLYATGTFAHWKCTLQANTYGNGVDSWGAGAFTDATQARCDCKCADPALTNCNGKCVDLKNDPDNCGECFFKVSLWTKFPSIIPTIWKRSL